MDPDSMEEPWTIAPREIDVPEDLLERIKPELEPGERLVWASRPGLRSRQESSGSFATALIWAGGLLLMCVACLIGFPFAIRAKLSGLDSVLLIFGSLSGLISVLIVIGTVAGWFSEGDEQSTLAGQVYALTDRRAIIWVELLKSKAVSVHTFTPTTINAAHIHRVEYPDGSGDVLFQELYNRPKGFVDVDEARRVEAMVRHYLVAPNPTSTP